MSPGDWCRPVCKGFGCLRLSFQSLAIYLFGTAAKCALVTAASVRDSLLVCLSSHHSTHTLLSRDAGRHSCSASSCCCAT